MDDITKRKEFIQFLEYKIEKKEVANMDTEREIKHLERRIQQQKLELDELYYDKRVVKSNYTKEAIADDIKRIERRIEQYEFKLWKLSKE